MKNQHIGFTLAEVLITLGIIGIVAEMTIPGLVENFQKTMYVSQLKSNYAIFTQGMKQYLIEQNVQSFGDTQLFKGTVDLSNPVKVALIDDIIKTNFKTVKTCSVGDTSCTNTYTLLNVEASTNKFDYGHSFCLVNGACYNLVFSGQCNPDYNFPSPLKANCAQVTIDVNGKAPPNKIGRDLFYYTMGHEGTLFANHSVPYAKLAVGSSEYLGNEEYWQEIPDYCGTLGSGNITNVFGHGCAARIMEESWQMNY